MIILSTPLAQLLLQISANSNVTYVTCWADITSVGLTPNVATGIVSNTNAATIVAESDSNFIQRQVTLISVVNTDNANTQTVQVIADGSTGQANLEASAVLLPGWSLHYLDGQGWQKYDSNGLIVSQANVFITGDATGNGTNIIPITLANTGVNAGSYVFTNLTVDSKGRLTAASNGANANTTTRGVTVLVDSITSQDTSNAATANAVSWAFGAAQANTANASLKANAAYGLANQAFVIGTQAFINSNLASNTANVAYGQANAAFLKANAGYALANQGFVVGTQALINANLASIQSNAAANTVAVFANGTIVLANSNVNFNNTSTINVSATANGTTQSNLAFSVNSAAVLSGVVSGNTSNINLTYAANGNVVIDTRVPSGGGGGGAYQVDVLANGSLIVANANLNFNNTATVNVAISANGTTQANISFSANATALGIPATSQKANAAYELANVAFVVGTQALLNANNDGIYANGTVVQANTSNLNFNNTVTVNVSITANGTTNTNAAFSVNTAQVAINTAPLANPLWYSYAGV